MGAKPRREGLLGKTNTASLEWADHGLSLEANEEFLEKNGFVIRIHRKKPPGRPMPETTRRAHALKSMVRSNVEHVFAVQKVKIKLLLRTVACTTVQIGMANILYNLKRVVFLDRLAAG